MVWYLKPHNILHPPPPPLSGASLSAAVSEHGFGQMLHARCALAYRRGRPWWDLPAPPPDTTWPTASSPANLLTMPCSKWFWKHFCQVAVCEGDWWRRGCGFGGGGTQWKVNWSIDQAVEERGKVPQVSRPVSFCRYFRHLLTFRSLCTMPFMWQWFTLSRICCMQWLWRRERPGQKQKGEEEGEQVNVRKQRKNRQTEHTKHMK